MFNSENLIKELKCCESVNQVRRFHHKAHAVWLRDEITSHQMERLCDERIFYIDLHENVTKGDWVIPETKEIVNNWLYFPDY